MRRPMLRFRFDPSTAPHSTRHAAPMREEATTNIDDERIASVLAATELCPSPSEAHGILCGLICGGHPDAESTWLSQLAPADADVEDDQDGRSGQQALRVLARATREELTGPELGLSLLVPDDHRPLAERATALYDWVRGFLYAWSLLGADASAPTGLIGEILRDFIQMTQMDLTQLDEHEENEQDLTELIEFTRVAALLIYQERVAAPAVVRS